MPAGNTEIMGEIVSTIHAKCDVVICITTGGGMNMTVDERIAAVPVFKPEMASCNLGSMNFALFPVLEKIKEWKYDWEPQYLEMSKNFIFRNTFADLERILKVFEAYDIGHLHNAHHFFSKGQIENPFYVQFVTGILGGIASTIPHLVHMKQTGESLFGKNFMFSTIGAGKT